MERWIRSKGAYGANGENKRIDDFLTEIIEVCKKHKLSISHEDAHGSFLIEEFNKHNVKWLMESSDYTE